MSEVDRYIEQFKDEVKARLMQIRELIKTEAPEAVESVAYGMPVSELEVRSSTY